MSTVVTPFLTPELYLRQERNAEFKSEYFRGETLALPGASREHNLIVGNLVGELGNALKGRSFEVYPSDMRAKVNASGLYTYPDMTIACSEPTFEDIHVDTLITPLILFEVTTESTESFDRGRKFSNFRMIESLKEYVLVAQDRCSVESFLKDANGHWVLRDFQSMDDSAAFHSIDVAVPMAEIYRSVTFEDPADDKSVDGDQH